MVSSGTVKCWVLAAALILSVHCCYSSGAVPESGALGGLDNELGLGAGEGEDVAENSDKGEDPAQITAKALLCFDRKAIYSGCEQSYRLSEAGNVDVPPGYTDQYCEGPCLAETNLVLDCVEHILSNFLFFNKATVRDIRDTIHSGCSYTKERGNFNVAEHLQAEESTANRAGNALVLLDVVLVFNLILWFA